MTELALPLLVAALVWWLGTGLVLYADGLPRRTFRASLSIATVVAAAAFAAAVATRDVSAPWAAYVGFLGGLALWGWNELLFLTGAVTGPRRGVCPVGAAGWARFVYATEAVWHHELAIAGTGVVLGAATLGAENATAFWTFALLWGMRLSAKFNLFLGVPNLSEDFLPDHLAYLESYFRRRPMNGLFPVSVTVGTAVAAALGIAAVAQDAAPGAATAYGLLASLAAFAVLEHWMMVMPPTVGAVLWGWAMPRARSARLGVAGAVD